MPSGFVSIRPPLPSEVLARYHSDKDTGSHGLSGHTYGPIYDQYLPRYRWASSVLEVGIGNGDSLRAWREFFPDAAVVGVDNTIKRRVTEGRISSVILDAGSEEELSLFAAEHHEYFSVIVDDASHLIEHQLLGLKVLWRSLRKGGVYFVEDIQDPADYPLFESLGGRVFDLRAGFAGDNAVAVYLKLED